MLFAEFVNNIETDKETGPGLRGNDMLTVRRRIINHIGLFVSFYHSFSEKLTT